MAITSFPFDGQDTTENQFSILFRELQTSGIAGSIDATNFKVSASTGMTVQVQPGVAILRGHAVDSSAIETLSIPTPAGGTIAHRVVLRLDTTDNSILLRLVSSAPGAAAPAPTQSLTGIFEIPLAVVTVPVGTVNVSAAMIVDDRDFIGQTVGAWSTAKRPVTARAGRTGFNTNLGYLETWNGSTWIPSMPVEAAGTVKMTASASIPAGWFQCLGQSLLKTDYPALHAAITTTYGGTSTHFNLPNLCGRTPIGLGTSVANGATAHHLGQQGGEETHVLSTAEMPSHNHGMPPVHAEVNGIANWEIPDGSGYVDFTRDAYLVTQNAGGNAAHNNMQPYLGINFIIKYV